MLSGGCLSVYGTVRERGPEKEKEREKEKDILYNLIEDLIIQCRCRCGFNKVRR